jgi:hypothetical protein
MTILAVLPESWATLLGPSNFSAVTSAILDQSRTRYAAPIAFAI